MIKLIGFLRSLSQSKFKAQLKKIFKNYTIVIHDGLTSSRFMSTEDLTHIEPVSKQFKKDDDCNGETLLLETGGDCSPESSQRLRKRKVALLFGYCGDGYYGLQRTVGASPQYRTIEDEVVDALVSTGAIPKNHAECMKKMSFQRAARTDKGVSAVTNVLSLKLLLLPSLVERLNACLPHPIRIFGYVRVCGSFNSKNSCDSRTYSYLLPTYAFADVTEFITPSYRIDKKTLDNARTLIGKYVGCHNFHNFTSGKVFTDPSCKRFIISAEISDPFLFEDCEFCTITIHGQSFMLHQIRKMISVLILISRGVINPALMDSIFGSVRMTILNVPAIGLFLERVHYDSYNRKYGNDGLHESLEFKQCDEIVAKFKNEQILSFILKKYVNELLMMEWLSYSLAHVTGPYSHLLHPCEHTGIGKAYIQLMTLRGCSKTFDITKHKETECQDDSFEDAVE